MADAYTMDNAEPHNGNGPVTGENQSRTTRFIKKFASSLESVVGKSG